VGSRVLASPDANSPETLLKYQTCWSFLRRWLSDVGITSPTNVQRDHAYEYVTWRTAQKVVGLRGKRAVSRNSALFDITVFRIIMYEALNRGYVASNPISKLRLKGDRPREKPELTPVQIEQIREELKRWPEWMRTSFEIALHQGCRFSETCLPLSDVNLKEGTVTFRLKGGKRHTTTLHPALRPLMERLTAEGRVMTYEMPRVGTASDWSRLFRRLKMRGYSFHCLRVTAITQMARAGINEQTVMRFIGHSTQEIHRIYQRLRVDDLSACVEAIGRSSSETQDASPATQPRDPSL
jgi:integrase